MPAKPTETTGGVKLGPGVGKFLYRIRQSHVAEHYGPLIASKAVGAVKLDLVLRCIALLPEHAGARKPGFVLWDWRYEHLHDLARTQPERQGESRSDRQSRHLKRKWVRDQLGKLSDLNLVVVKPRKGERPEIRVRRDNGRGKPIDDPGAAGGKEQDRYLTVRGSLIAAGALASWEAPEVAAYLAALYAEAHNDRGAGRTVKSDGTGTWWRQLAWFSDTNMFPLYRDPLPFSKSLLEDGLALHRKAGLITVDKRTHNPVTRRRLDTPRNVYTDYFDHYDGKVARVTAAGYRDALEGDGQEP